MIKTILNYTIKTIFRRKKAFVASVLSIILASMLIVAVSNVVFSLVNSLEKYKDSSFGNVTGLLYLFNQESLDAVVSSDKFTVAGIVSRFGTVSCDRGIFDGSVTVGSIDDNLKLQPFINLVEGRFPKQPGEAVLEMAAIDKLGLLGEINETFKILIKDVSGSERILSLTIVGIIESYTINAKIYDKPFDDSYTIFVDGSNNASLYPGVILYDTANEFPVRETFAAISNIDGDELSLLANELKTDYRLSPAFDKNSGIFSIDNEAKIVLSITLGTVVIIAIVCLISYYSFSEKTFIEHCRVLKLLGADFKELSLYVILNLAVTLTIALPIGLAGGVLTSLIISKSIVGVFLKIYKFSISIFGVFVGIMIPTILLFALSLCRLVDIVDTRPLLVGKTKKLQVKKYLFPVNDRFIKWCLSCRKKRISAYRGISIALLFGLTIVQAGNIFIQGILDQYDRTYYHDYSLNIQDRSYFSQFRIWAYPFSGLSESMIKKISECDEIKSIWTQKVLRVLLATEERYDYFGTSKHENSSDFEYKQLTSEVNLPSEFRYYEIDLIEANEYLLYELLTLGHKINLDGSGDGKRVVAVCSDIESYPYKVGDTVRLLQLFLENPLDPDFSNADRFDETFIISAVIELSKEDNPVLTSCFGNKSDFFVFLDGSFDEIGLQLNTNRVQITLDHNEVYEKTEALLSEICTVHRSATIVSRVENNSWRRALVWSILLSALCIVIFIYFVCFMTLLNVVRARYIEEKQIWGVLRAMGLSKSKVITIHVIDVTLLTLIPILLHVIMCLIVMPLNSQLVYFNAITLSVFASTIILANFLTFPSVFGVLKGTISRQIKYIE